VSLFAVRGELGDHLQGDKDLPFRTRDCLYHRRVCLHDIFQLSRISPHSFCLVRRCRIRPGRSGHRTVYLSPVEKDLLKTAHDPDLLPGNPYRCGKPDCHDYGERGQTDRRVSRHSDHHRSGGVYKHSDVDRDHQPCFGAGANLVSLQDTHRQDPAGRGQQYRNGRGYRYRFPEGLFIGLCHWLSPYRRRRRPRASGKGGKPLHGYHGHFTGFHRGYHGGCGQHPGRGHIRVCPGSSHQP